MRSWIGFVGMALLAATSGCKGDDDEIERQGSAACQDFQDAVCDFAADRCGLVGRGECDDNFSGVQCTSDALAGSCSNQLNDAVCGRALPGCNLLEVIDPAPAVGACNRLIDAVCKQLMSCGQGPSLEACVMMTAMSIDCTQAIAVDPKLDDCLEQIDGKLCNTGMLPDGCHGIIRVLPPGVSAAMPN